MAVSFELHQPRGRTRDHQIVLYETDGSTGILMESTDVLRVKIFRGNSQTPDLELFDISDTSNDSGITITQRSAPATATLRIAQADTENLPLGVYEVDIIVVDDSESAPVDAAKQAMGGLLYLTGTGGGDLGLT